MMWQAFSITVILLLATAIAVACMQSAWSRRKTPGAYPFAWLMLAVTIWTLGAALEYAGNSTDIKQFWLKFQYLGISILPVFWLLFAAEYSQVVTRSTLLKPRYLTPLFIPSAITIALALTNEFHQLIWQEVSILQQEPHLVVEYQPGLWFWIQVVYAYALLFIGTAILGWSLARFPDLYRRQAAALITGALIPWVVSAAHLAGFRPLPGVDLTTVAFVVTGVIYALEVFRYHLFDLVPVAQDTVVESMRDGVIVIDERERIVYMNPAGKAMVHLTDRINSAPETLAIWPELVNALRQSSHAPGTPHVIQLCIDGARPRFLEVQVDPLYRSPARAAGRLILLRDVTNQKEAQEQLRLQSVALAAAPYSIIITNTDGEIQWVNPAFSRMTGYTQEEAIGQNPRLLKSGRHDAGFYQQLWETILAGQIWQGEIINRRKDGQTYVEDATIAPVVDSSGAITHFIAIKQNVTPRKELEKTRDDLIQAIVHDLRNPINNILFSLEMIQRLPALEQIPSEISGMIGIGRENAWRMLGLINSILDLSRLESGNLPLVCEPLVLTELVEATIHSQALTAQRREVLILNGVPYDLPCVVADRIMIGRVLQNLLDNALKFTTQGSNVEVGAATHADGSSIVISVHDDGPGIPADLRSQLFQKFATGVTPQRGSGLGLAFCRLAIEAHHGRIWVESGENDGTTFMFTLPIEENTGAAVVVEAPKRSHVP